MPLKTTISSLIVTFAFCIVSCSTFIHFEMNDNYFQLLPMSVGVGIVAAIAVLSCVVKRNHSGLHFTLPDVLFCIMVAYYAIRYDYQLQLANWKIIYAVLLLLLWFSARIILSTLSISKSILLGGFAGIGCLLAIWGLLQLYGFQESNHYLFSITGPFYNPGPYSGYIAMLSPVCFSQLLSTQGKKRYIWLLTFSMMVIILPAGMSRSAWLALLISCTWLLIIQKGWFNKIKSYTESQPKRMFLLSFLTVCLLLTIAFFIFQLKADSANGRLFIWKNTCKAIQEQPLLGYGPGSFSTIYGKTQAAYFSSGNYSPRAHIAGTPEYAFNECLQVCIEGGIPLLLLFSAFLITSFYKGIRNKEYASCAGLLSLFIFSLFSYSLQILPFGIMGVLLLATCISTNEIVSHTEKRKIHITILSICVLLASIGFSDSLWHVKEVAEKWNQSNTLRVQKAFKEASVGYKELYKEMKYNINFLLNYAQILSAQKKYSEACEVLEQAKRVSCDVTIWNVQGRNYQLAGHYTTAETCFKESLNLLPTRLYPYYLLAKLYTEPTFFDREKAKKMAIIVLTKPPKVHSKATDEMKTEMKTLLNRLLHNY